MPSSLFNDRPVPRKVPCINHPPPPPDPIEPPGTMPRQLSGACLWRDLYAPEFWETAAFVDLYSTDGGQTYYGQTPVHRGFMALQLQRVDALPLWNVTIRIGETSPPLGFYTWYNVQVDPLKPFDTGLLHHENPLSPPDLFLLWARVVL